MEIVIKLGLIFLSVSLLFFLTIVLPRLKAPGWERKIEAARYLREKQMPGQADELLEKAIGQYPDRISLYHIYYQYYSAPGNMKKIYDIFARGYEQTKDSGLGVIMARFLIEEGETEKAAPLLEGKKAEEFMLTHSMPVWAEYYYRRGEPEQAETAFVSFYRKLYPDAAGEKELFSYLGPKELILLPMVRKLQGKNWRSVMEYIPVKSVMAEEDWLSYYRSLQKEQESISVISGIYGPAERLLEFRSSELEKKTGLLRDVMKIYA